MRAILLICFCMMASHGANAFVLGSLSGELDPSKQVHLLVIGHSDGMGTQFLTSAVARARRYQELYPDHEVVFLRNNEYRSERDADELRDEGVQVLSRSLEPLGQAVVVRMAISFYAIASIDFFTHSNMHAGAGLEDGLHFNSQSASIMQLRGRFSHEAYIFFHGCNIGYFQGPEISHKLGVVVFGAFTSTDFQRLHAKNVWFNNNPGQYPSFDWAQSNKISYAQSIPCYFGACLRMKPDNFPYSGMWGNFRGGGLGFYKAFCNNGISEGECSQVMAASLLAWPSIVPLNRNSSDAAFLKVALEYLCPIDVTQSSQQRCFAALNAALKPGASEVYSPFQGNSLDCDYRSCNASWRCDYNQNGDAIVGSCSVRAPINDEPVTMVQELKRYIMGFRELR